MIMPQECYECKHMDEEHCKECEMKIIINKKEDN